MTNLVLFPILQKLKAKAKAKPPHAIVAVIAIAKFALAPKFCADVDTYSVENIVTRSHIRALSIMHLQHENTSPTQTLL